MFKNIFNQYTILLILSIFILSLINNNVSFKRCKLFTVSSAVFKHYSNTTVFSAGTSAEGCTNRWKASCGSVLPCRLLFCTPPSSPPSHSCSTFSSGASTRLVLLVFCLSYCFDLFKNENFLKEKNTCLYRFKEINNQWFIRFTFW